MQKFLYFGLSISLLLNLFLTIEQAQSSASVIEPSMLMNESKFKVVESDITVCQPTVLKQPDSFQTVLANKTIDFEHHLASDGFDKQQYLRETLKHIFGEQIESHPLFESVFYPFGKSLSELSSEEQWLIQKMKTKFTEQQLEMWSKGERLEKYLFFDQLSTVLNEEQYLAFVTSTDPDFLLVKNNLEQLNMTQSEFIEFSRFQLGLHQDYQNQFAENGHETINHQVQLESLLGEDSYQRYLSLIDPIFNHLLNSTNNELSYEKVKNYHQLLTDLHQSKESTLAHLKHLMSVQNFNDLLNQLQLNSRIKEQQQE